MVARLVVPNGRMTLGQIAPCRVPLGLLIGGALFRLLHFPRMVSVAYYRAEAERCRALAAGTRDNAVAARWYRIAQDYENLANSLEAAPDTPPPPVMHVPMQQQPVQQQQAKTEPDDKE